MVSESQYLIHATQRVSNGDREVYPSTFHVTFTAPRNGLDSMLGETCGVIRTEGVEYSV